MFPFLIGFLGGATLSGSYVLLRTPRSGHDNQRFWKEYYYTAKYSAEVVQEKAANVQAAVNNLKTEATKLQVGFVPEVKKMADDFQTEVAVHTRRINDEIEQINRQVEVMNNRINVQNATVQVDQSSSDSDHHS